jgi:hypothetical protein
MNLNRKLRLVSLTLTLVVLFSFALAAGHSSAGSQGADIFTYLPSITYQAPPRGIYGLVSQDGVPAGGVNINLNLREGSNVTTIMTVATDPNGNYSFLGAPSLGSGQQYFVYYPNSEDVASRVTFWAGFLINSYTAGDELNGADFDIANINLVTPAPASVVTLPTTFTWNPRPASPGDSYEFNLIDDETQQTYFYTNPPLGYVNSYTLNSLPGNMVYDESYGWTIWAYGPGGSLSAGNFGASYFAYGVTFVQSAAHTHTPTIPTHFRANLDLAFQRLAP